VQERRLLASRVALAFAGYGFLICREEPFARIPYRALAALVPVCFAAFLVCLWPVARRLRRGELVDLIAFETVGAAASAITLFVPILFLDLVFYHLFVWILLPLRQLRSTLARLRFLAETAVVSGLLFCFTPWLGWFPALTSGWWIR